MTRLRETLNPEETHYAFGAPTRTKTAENQHPLPCWACGETYYVDERTHREFMHAVEYDVSDNPFLCERCIEEQAEDEHSRA
ncbi:MAG TPA: hypothetical protein VJH03_00830 [Blastocatellia bacterium]|nr:hypothetical protein [Blastocatellia bacterium]